MRLEVVWSGSVMLEDTESVRCCVVFMDWTGLNLAYISQSVSEAATL